MDKTYLVPKAALRKLRVARNLAQTVYIYGATGYGKTELIRQYLSNRRYCRLSCADLPWEEGSLPPPEPGRNSRQVVVIDDLHLMQQENQRQIVLNLIQRQDLWLILISRSPIPLWLMPSYISTGFIVISEQDLCLGKAEIAKWLDGLCIPYTEPELQYLFDTCEGNAYVIHHVSLCMKEGKHPGPDLKQEVWNAFAAYLENHVMVRWDSDLLEFLMQVSIVDEFTLELAEMISGDGRVRALLERAAETGNFLTESGGVYRLRPVLIAALRSRAEKFRGTEYLKDCAYRAGLYYSMHDQLLQALGLFEFCGRTDRIRELLIRNARMNPGTGHYYELRHYYLSLSEDEIQDSPVLMAGMSMLQSMLMEPEKSEYWYEKLKSFAGRAKGGEKREAQSRLAYLDIGLPHRGSRNMVEILKSIPALIFDKNLTLPELCVTSNLPSTMNGGKDFCHWSPVDRQLAKTIGPLVERILGRHGKGLVKAALGESFYEKGGDTFQVLSLLSQAQMEAERGGTPEIAFAAVGLRTRLMAVSGDLGAARELLSDFEPALRRQNALRILPNLQALQCRLALLAGEQSAVDHWMTSAPNEDQEFFSMERYRYLTKVRVYIATGKYLRALALLEKLRYYAEQAQRTYVRMETGVLMAVVRNRMGGEWQEVLLKTLEEAGSFGFIRLISEEGAAVCPLLRQVAKNVPAALDREWFSRLLSETENMSRRYPLYLRGGPPPGEFCGTALQILRLQAEGLSVNQIAQRLEMKANTVKYHIKENYRKLGVSGKAAALLAARGLGLL